MINRKILTIVFAGAMALSMAACGNSASTVSNVASASESSAVTTVSADASSASSISDQDSVTTDSTEDRAPAQLADLYAQGYTMGACSYSDGTLSVNYTNADHTDFLRAECSMAEDQCDEFFNIDFLAEDYDQQCQEYLESFPDLTIRSLNNDLPDMAQYEEYIGKTVEDMENDGFELAGYNDDGNGKLVLEFYAYADSGDTYVLRVYPEGEPEDDALYDDETILSLAVGKIIFWDFA